MLQNSINLMVQPEISPVNYPLSTLHWLTTGHSQLLACWFAARDLLTRTLVILNIYKR